MYPATRRTNTRASSVRWDPARENGAHICPQHALGIEAGVLTVRTPRSVDPHHLLIIRLEYFQFFPSLLRRTIRGTGSERVADVITPTPLVRSQYLLGELTGHAMVVMIVRIGAHARICRMQNHFGRTHGFSIHTHEPGHCCREVLPARIPGTAIDRMN